MANYPTRISRPVLVLAFAIFTVLTLIGLAWALLIGSPWLSLIFAVLWALAGLIYYHA